MFRVLFKSHVNRTLSTWKSRALHKLTWLPWAWGLPATVGVAAPSPCFNLHGILLCADLFFVIYIFLFLYPGNHSYNSNVNISKISNYEISRTCSWNAMDRIHFLQDHTSLHVFHSNLLPWQILFALANLRACLALSYGNKRQLLKSAFEPCFERQRPAFVFN